MSVQVAAAADVVVIMWCAMMTQIHTSIHTVSGTQLNRRVTVYCSTRGIWSTKCVQRKKYEYEYDCVVMWCGVNAVRSVVRSFERVYVYESLNAMRVYERIKLYLKIKPRSLAQSTGMHWKSVKEAHFRGSCVWLSVCM